MREITTSHHLSTMPLTNPTSNYNLQLKKELRFKFQNPNGATNPRPSRSPAGGRFILYPQIKMGGSLHFLRH